MFTPIRDKDLILKTLKKYGIRTKYILFVGRIEPRKNITNLLKAFEYIKTKGYRELCLVIVGNQDKIFKERDLFTFIEKMRLHSDVIFTGGISEKDLCILYNGAEMLVYPAFAEGFGLPVVEAMACGTPVITSNTTALQEIAKDAAILINPCSIQEIAEGIERVLKEEELRQELSSRGLQRSKKFRWDETAKKTIAVYQEVLA